MAVNGLKKNCQSIRVGSKLHNYVINVDRLNFLNIAEDDLKLFGVARLNKVIFDNNSYYPVVNKDVNTIASTRINDDNEDRRLLIVKCIIERELSRPQHNINRNK